DVLVPFAIALLWIAHPIHTEVVANIKSRDELLAFLFSILTMWQCVQYVSTPQRKHLVLSGAFYIGGLYLRLLFFPHPMSSDYSFRQVPVVGFDNPVAIGSLLAYVGLFIY